MKSVATRHIPPPITRVTITLEPDEIDRIVKAYTTRDFGNLGIALKDAVLSALEDEKAEAEDVPF